MAQVPTIGRQVHYHSHPSERGMFNVANVECIDDKQLMAATICYVHADLMHVNLHVVDHAGNMHARQRVRLLRENEIMSEGQMYCVWPPRV